MIYTRVSSKNSGPAVLSNTLWSIPVSEVRHIMIIEDLVHAPAVRTVVRLADLQDHNLRRGLVENFIITDEVAFILSGILGRMEKNEPQGFFIIGNYGSGKSHLLNVLNLLLTDRESRSTLEAEPTAPSRDSSAQLPGQAEKIAASTPLLVVEISLVEYSNREYLEQIILSQVEKRLLGKNQAGSPARQSSSKRPLEEMPRQEAFQTLKNTLHQEGYGGLVLLVDELSEFLRSKDNPRAYNEDIRFLQYLGEFAESIPAWVIATMQENIENTGALTGEMLHKIKDRYPARFRLTGEHVKEIVSRRLVQKKESAAETLPALYEEHRRAFGRLPFSPKDFQALYPVHPQTVELLDELRPLFSQHRGVVDFIHYRLAGDERRGIEPFLEQPAEQLLTPDYIFDHFRDRIRETVETSPYSEEVFHYFQREVASIFPEEEDAHTALRLVKLLILQALAPSRKPFTAQELTGLLLHHYTDLDVSVNYDYIEEILQKLLAHGAYVTSGDKEDGSGSKTYTIDLRADAALLVKKKLAQVSSSFHPGDPRVTEGLFAWLEESFLPLNKLQQEPNQATEITWQNTTRQGKVLFYSPDYLTPRHVKDLQEEVDEQETDFIFFLAKPQFSTAGPGDDPLPGDPEEIPAALVFWQPREITPEEEESLRQAYACDLLHQEYAADDSPTGKQIREHLQGTLENQQRQVKEIFRDIYFQGTLKTAHKSMEPSALGYLHFNELVSSAVAEVLKKRFPRHFEICPRSQHISQSLVQRALDTLASPDAQKENLQRGTQAAIESHLQAMGVVKRRGSTYTLEFSPRSSPLVAEFLSLVPDQERIPLQDLYWKLRKGPFGLSKDMFQVLGLAAILSGAVSAYQGGKRLAPAQVNYYRFWKIDEIAAGTIVRPELQELLPEIPFLPPRLQVTPLTFSTQQAAWEHVTAFKEEMRGKIEEIRGELKRLEGSRFLPGLNQEKIERILQRFLNFLEEIKVSYSSQEGLERFLAAYQSNPLAAEDLNRVNALYEFFKEDLREFLRLGYYLHDPGLEIPRGERYESLSRRHRMLLELLEEEEIAWDKKLRERIQREFKLFQDEYITLYLQEHSQFAGEETLQPYRNLARSSHYKLLERLGKTGLLSVESDMAQVNRQLSAILEKECRQAEDSLLRERPLCPCSFRLGQTQNLPLTTELEARILRSIRSGLQVLQERENKEKIAQYAENLEIVGRRREAEPLLELLELPASDTNISSRLEELLDQKTVNHLHKALLGEAVIIERSLDDLHELLAGRVFTTEQLKEIFFNWALGGGGQTADYIRITEEKQQEKSFLTPSPETGPADQNLGSYYPTFSALESSKSGFMAAEQDDLQGFESVSGERKSLLEQHFPTLLPLMHQVGEKEFFATSLLLAWLTRQEMETTELVVDEEQSQALQNLLRPLLKGQTKEFIARAADLCSLGNLLLGGEAAFSPAILSSPLALLEDKYSGSELLELYFRQVSAGTPQNREGAFDFNRLLERLVQEPLFANVVFELFRKTAAQVTTEENKVNIKVLKSSLAWAQKELKEKGEMFSPAKKDLTREKQSLLHYLELLLESNLSLRTAEAAAQGPPEKDTDWENSYRQFSPFELQFSLLEQSPAGIRSVFPVERWKRFYSAACDVLGEKFQAYLEKKAAPEKRFTLEKLLQQYNKWLEKHKGPGGAYLVILDGARLDTWNHLLPKITAEANYRIAREGLTWALLPTVTETQLEPLKEKWLLGHIVNLGEEALFELLSDPASFLAAVDNKKKRGKRPAAGQKNPPLEAIKLDYLDDKVHTSSDNLVTLLEEILLQSRKKLWPLLDNIAPGSLVLLLSDHGFRTNHYFQRAGKTDEPRYLHGGATPFEVLAPWTLLEKK